MSGTDTGPHVGDPRASATDILHDINGAPSVEGGGSRNIVLARADGDQQRQLEEEIGRAHV